MTTYTAFVTALSGLTVTGVTRKYAYPPEALSTADLPASWPQVPAGDFMPITFGTAPGLSSDLRCDLIVAYEPVGQNTSSVNFAGTLTMMDNLSAALKGMSRPVQGRFAWSIRQAIITVAGLEYWALVGSCEGAG